MNKVRELRGSPSAETEAELHNLRKRHKYIIQKAKRAAWKDFLGGGIMPKGILQAGKNLEQTIKQSDLTAPNR